MIEKSAKPFLKWAGGKTQLISEIEKNLPPSVIGKKFTYIEPFVGSGAVLFWMLGEFTQLEKAVVNDIYEDLINTYKTCFNGLYRVNRKNKFNVPMRNYKKPTICNKNIVISKISIENEDSNRTSNRHYASKWWLCNLWAIKSLD